MLVPSACTNKPFDSTYGGRATVVTVASSACRRVRLAAGAWASGIGSM